jgi:hypothetical protein
MTEIISKISSYNLFNYLLPGVLYSIIATKWTIYDFTIENVILGAFLYYFIGMVISRIGSLWIEKLLTKGKIVKFAEYGDFVKASKKDEKLNLLSETNNSYRTIISLGICLLITKAYSELDLKIGIPEIFTSILMLAFITFIFILSYKKQTEYITKRIEANND